MTGEPVFGGGGGTALDAIPMPPSATFVGYRFREIDREAMTMTVDFEASEAMLNPAGGVQGGFYAVMLDEVMGSLVLALNDGKLRPATVDLHTQFFKPAVPGPLVGRARVTRMGRTMVFTEATLSNASDEPIAMAIQSAKLVPTGV